MKKSDVFTLLLEGKEKAALQLVQKSKVARAAKNPKGSTVLMAGARFNAPELVAHLIESGANVNAVRPDGYTALMFAAAEGHTRVAELLVAAGADLNAMSEMRSTALSLASRSGHEAVAALLVRSGCELEGGAQGPDDFMHEAVKAGHRELVAALVARGVKGPVKLRSGDRAALSARTTQPKELGYEEAQVFLKARGVLKRLKPWWPARFSEPVLVLPGGTKLRSLRLDHDFALSRGLSRKVGAGVVVDGDLHVEGLLQNGELDFGPFLVVLGDLRVQRAAVGGSPIHVVGDLVVDSVYLGAYNHGLTTVEGKTKAGLFMSDGYGAELRGKATGTFVYRTGRVRGAVPPSARVERVLKPAFFQQAGDDVDVHSSKLYAAMVRGADVLAPRSRR